MLPSFAIASTRRAAANACLTLRDLRLLRTFVPHSTEQYLRHGRVFLNSRLHTGHSIWAALLNAMLTPFDRDRMVITLRCRVVKRNLELFSPSRSALPL